MISLLLTLPLLMAMPDQGKGSSIRTDLDASGSIQHPPASIYEQKYWRRIEDIDNDDLRANQVLSGDFDGPLIHRHYRNSAPTDVDPFETLPEEHAFGYNLQQSDLELNMTQRIVGGFTVKSMSQVSYQAALKNDEMQFCGGTIIGQYFILTAAHCFERLINKLTVTVGTLSRSTGGVTYLTERTIIHKDWEAATFKNDVAVVKTTDPIQFSINVQYLKLASAAVPDNKDTYVSGWGLTANPGGVTPEYLRAAFLKSFNNKECMKRHKFSTLKITEKTLCTFNTNGDATCQGDSGGPLVYLARVAGIVSWGTPCAQGFPDAFSSVFHFRDDIADMVKSY